MIERLDYEQVAGTQLSPIAEIALPVTWFKRWGMTFTEDTDDLDVYELAAGRSKAHGLFALMNYIHGSMDVVTLMVPHAAADSSDLAHTVSGLAAEFGLPAAVFRFRLNGEEAPPLRRPNPSVAA